MSVSTFYDDEGNIIHVSTTNPLPMSSIVPDGSVTEAKLAPALDDKINGKLNKSGGVATSDLSLGSNKLTNVADPTANQDGATKSYIDTQIAAIPAAFTPKGSWDASTNTPTLADGTGTAGDTYRVSTGGTQDLGSGSQTFAKGDHVIYDGATWVNLGQTAAVSSVNGKVGIVVLDASDVGALPLGGGTLTGDLHMSEKKIINLADGASARDAVNKQQLDTKGGLEQANTWTAKQVFTKSSGDTDPSVAVASDNPQFELRNSGSDTDEKRWNFVVNSDQLDLRALTDAGDVADTAWLLTRSGGTVTAHSFHVGGDSYLSISNASDITASVDLHMSSNKITDVADPTDAQDAATKAYVDSKPGMNKVAHMDPSIATDVEGIVANYNALLQNMIAAGIMDSE